MAENIVIYTVRVNTEDGKVKIDGLTKSFVSAENAVKKLNTEVKKNHKRGFKPNDRQDWSSGGYSS